MKTILPLLIFSVACAIMAESFTVKPEDAVIVVGAKAGGVARLAAKELQYYVRMMTGKTVPIETKAVPGKYAFLFVHRNAEELHDGFHHSFRRVAVFLHHTRSK